MKSRAHLKKTSDAAAEPYPSTRGLSDSAKNFQQRALPSTISPNDADHFALLHLERYFFEGPELFLRFCLGSFPSQNPTPQRARPGK